MQPATLPASSDARYPILQFSTLAEVSARISRARTVEEVLNVVASEVRWLLTAEMCTLALVSPDDQTFQVYSRDISGVVTCAATYDTGCSGLVAWVIARRQTLRLANLPVDWLLADIEHECLIAGARSVMLLPLFDESRVVGVLCLSARRAGAYAAEAMTIGRLLALQVEGAVRNALLLEDFDGRESVILSLALAIEAKDAYTEDHCRRLADYADKLGMTVGISEQRRTTLRMAAMLHDVGKLAVPEAILNKPGPLTPEEYEVLKRHSTVGEQICHPLRSARAILPTIRHHHERWDGGGYPDGLVGGDTPIEARIIAIVDAFDAMTSDRPYRSALPLSVALNVMRDNSGPQWDHALLNTFLGLVEAGEIIRFP